MEKLDIFILSLFQHGNKVRATTLAHLLKGKRTTSILIYGYFNQLLPYFGLFPQMDERKLKKIITYLIKEGYLETTVEEKLVSLTVQGRHFLIKTSNFQLPDLDGIAYANTDDEYIEGLLFATQIISEYVHHNKKYVPIESNPAIQLILKRWFQRLEKKPAELGQQMYQEWLSLVKEFPTAIQSGLVNLLSGHNQIGQTTSQLIDFYQLSPFEGYLLRKNYSHRVIKILTTKAVDYPLLSSVYPFFSRTFINDSALISYQLLTAGHSVQEICQRRKLKESTVVDHLIEWAILDQDFPLTLLLTKEILVQLDAYEKEDPVIRQWQYKDVIANNPAIDFLTLRCYQIMRIREGA